MEAEFAKSVVELKLLKTNVVVVVVDVVVSDAAALNDIQGTRKIFKWFYGQSGKSRIQNLKPDGNRN